MTFASNETSLTTKLVASVVGLAASVFMLGLTAVPAQAQQSNAELRAQIQGLLDTISQLQAQVDGQSSGSTSADPYMNCNAAMFDARIGQGASGQGVVALQQFLNMSPDTQVAQSGPGSPGNETSFYGPLTAQAVTAFQEKYSSDVLMPVGLSSGTGYWGSSTASKAGELCTTNMRDDDMAGGDDSDGSDDSGDLDDILGDDGDDSDDSDDDNQLSGGEASLEGFDLDDGDDSDVEEGGTASVADIEFDVEDADVEIKRADITMGLTGNKGSADTEPWDVFEEVTLLDGDGDEVASVDVSDEDDWKDDDPIADSDHDLDNSVDYYQVRLTNLNTIVRENDMAEFTVEAETQNNVDDAQNSPEWEVAVLEDGIRARDGQGIDQYAGKNDDSVRFDIEEEGQGEELDISSSSDDPDESILPVDEDDNSDEYGVFAFDMEAEEGDLDLDTADVNLDFTGNQSASGAASNTDVTYNDVVDDAYLEIDGEQFDVDSEQIGNASTTNDESTSTLTFDIDEDYTVEEDSEVTATLFLEFESQDGNYEEGVTVQGSIDDQAISFEGADDGDSNGSATGEAHTLLVRGLFAEDPADIDVNTTDNYVQYAFEVDVTAFEDDVYLNSTSSASDISNRDDEDGEEVPFWYTIENHSTGTVETYDVVSSADETNNYNYVVREGDTESFTITVEYDTPNKSSYRMILDEAKFSTDDDRDWTDGSYDFTPEDDYRSGLFSETDNN